MIYVYSADQAQRIRDAANDGMALNIAMYSIGHQFVDANGNPSNYAQRLFSKRFTKSTIRFPANGYSGVLVPGASYDISIKGLNFNTGEFDDLRMIDIRTNQEMRETLMRGIFETIFQHGIDEIINRMYRLPPIITPPGLHDPFTPPPGPN